MNKKYSLGLDIGTNSVGWAVVDENNQLIRKNGKTLWGVRMFTESQVAATRRGYRCQRRRLNRRKQRINLLNEIFKTEIDKIDKGFFDRLETSYIITKDREGNNKNVLFKNFISDEEYYDLYPTIYHLRKHLCESDKKEDIRIIYMALHNIIKYRGNFLLPGDVFKANDFSRIKEIFNNFNDLQKELKDNFEDCDDYFREINFNEKIDELNGILNNKKNGVREKKEKLKELFSVDNKSFVYEYLIQMLVSHTCKIESLKPVKEKKYEKSEIDLDSENLESRIDSASLNVPEMDAAIDFCIQVKEITDFYYLLGLLGEGNNSISKAMISKYEEHKRELRALKLFVKEYLPDKYKECFKEKRNNLNNYARYIGNDSLYKNKKVFGSCSREEFYKYLRSEIFGNIKEGIADEAKESFLQKMENNIFLEKQRTNLNGSIPMQLHLQELRQIIKNQSKYYPFLAEKAENGQNKIESIFSFKIPYYVGPLNNKSENYAWVIRSNEKIYPWNFDKVVDKDATALGFIQKMQNKCTYLKGEMDYCLPKKSIIFSEYNCLSYLNKLRFDGRIIDKNIKNRIFEEVFLKHKKPTKNNIYEFMKTNYGYSKLSNSKLDEIPDINCDMRSYIDMQEILGEKYSLDLAENIIQDITIFEDKEVLKGRLLKYEVLTEEQIKSILKLKYKDFSSLSKNLLDGIEAINPQTGEIGTVLKIMKDTNANLQEIIYGQEYRLIDRIYEYNKKNQKEIKDIKEYIDENIAITPKMIRSYIQSYRIIEEVEKILGAKIDKYYIECTREEDKAKKGNKTKSRYENLKELYKGIKDGAIYSYVSKEELVQLEKELEENKENVRSDKYFLYFTQLGRCMYSLNPINIRQLNDNTLYDIDHIYPQAIIKDDSLDNRVLVLKSKNNPKQDVFLWEIEGFLNKDCYAFYKMLLDKNLIKKEKYEKLVEKELSKEKLNSFVDRQIVSTNQAVKGLIQTLIEFKKVPKEDIIYSRAAAVTFFRKKNEIIKSRIANNYHHAHDAYLNVVVGRVIHNYYTKNNFNKFSDYNRMKLEGKTVNYEGILSINIPGIWEMNRDLEMIKYNCQKRFDIIETTRTSFCNSMFHQVTILPADKGEIPIKTTDARLDTEKYGRIKSASYAKYCIISIDTKKGKEYKLIAIPRNFCLLGENASEKSLMLERKYIERKGIRNFEILNNKIQNNQLIFDGKKRYIITGVSNDSYVVQNAVDRNFNSIKMLTIHKIEKYNKCIEDKIELAYKTQDEIIISPKGSDRSKEIILTKGELVNLYMDICNKFKKDTYSYSIIKEISNNLDSCNIEAYTIAEIIELVNQLLKLLKTNERNTADLSSIKMAKQSGTLKISSLLHPGMKFMSSSTTGYYTKCIFVVPNN